MPHSITIQFHQGQASKVYVDCGAVDGLPDLWHPDWREAALIGDANVMRIYGEKLARRIEPLVQRLVFCDFPPGEPHKTRATKEMIEDRLLTQGLSRETCIVALGGGISLDLAGFVAATYLRGVPHLNVPTSLLAQVDASIGGKTGVNTSQGKNLIGAFHQPAAVIIDPCFLPTLPVSEWINGLAEMVKHAVVADADLFTWIETHAQKLHQPGLIDDYPLRRCVEIKTSIVEADERETGLRSILNFGHTIGHALERASDYRLSHGQAVAMGMLVEAQVASTLTGFSTDEVSRLSHLLRLLHFDLRPPVSSFQELIPFLGTDKKRKSGQLRLALPAHIGEMARVEEEYTLAVSLPHLEGAWEAGA